MSYLERRLRDLEVRRRADEISQQIEEQQKLEKEATKNEKDVSVGKTALEYGTAPLILPKYFQEDGKYMKQPTILGFPIPFAEEEVTQDEFIKGHADDINRKIREGSGGRLAEALMELAANAAGMTARGVLDMVMPNQEDVIEKILEYNPKDEKKYYENKPGFIDNLHSLWNQTMGNYFDESDNIDYEGFNNVNTYIEKQKLALDKAFNKPGQKTPAFDRLPKENQEKVVSMWTNDFYNKKKESADFQNRRDNLENKIQKQTKVLSDIYAKYQPALDKSAEGLGGMTTLMDSWDKRSKALDEFDSFTRSMATQADGGVTSLINDKELPPLSSEKYTDSKGRIFSMEKTATGNLFDTKELRKDTKGNIIIDTATGEPLYFNKYSAGRKMVEGAKNLFTTETGYQDILQGAGSVAAFAAPGIPLAKIGQVASDIGKFNKIGNFALNFASASILNEMESNMQGRQAFDETYEEELSKMSGLNYEQIYLKSKGLREIPGENLHLSASPEDELKAKAEYKQLLYDWAEKNPKRAAQAMAKAKVSGQVAKMNNELLVGTQMFELDLIAKALKGGKNAVTASDNILKGAKRASNISWKATKTLAEAGSEGFEENWNDYAVEKGKAVARGEIYSIKDFNFSDAKEIESGLLGSVLGGVMAGITTTAEIHGENKEYKKQKKFVDALNDLPKEIKKQGLNTIITGLSVDEFKSQINEMNKVKDNPGKVKAIAESMLTNRAIVAAQTGTSGKLIEVLNKVLEDTDSPQEKENLQKAVEHVKYIADAHDALPTNIVGRSQLLWQAGNLRLVEDAMSDLQNELPAIQQKAREKAEIKVRNDYGNSPQLSQRLADLETNKILANEPVMVKYNNDLENLKNRRASIITKIEELQSSKGQAALKEEAKKSKIEKTLNSVTKDNVEQNIAQVEKIQEKPLTNVQKNKITNNLHPEPIKAEDVVPKTTVSPKIAKIAENSTPQEKDEELSTLASMIAKPTEGGNRVGGRKTTTTESTDPDAAVVEDMDPDAAYNSSEEEGENFQSLLLLNPTEYNENDVQQKELINALKNRLKVQDETRKKAGGDNHSSFEDFFNYTVRATSPLEAEKIFNMTKQAYKEFNQEIYPDRVIETDEQIAQTYTESFPGFSKPLLGEEKIEKVLPEKPTTDVLLDEQKSTEVSLEGKNEVAPELTASDGTQLKHKGLKVDSFYLKIPFLGQTYDVIIDKENGTIEFKTNNETVLKSAIPFLNWNILTPGKKVTIALPIVDGKLTMQSLAQPMSVWSNGKIVKDATLKDFLEAIFEGEKAEDLIQQYTLKQLIEKELGDNKNIEESLILRRIPVNLEAEGMSIEEGLGKGLHDVEWWNSSNIADFTESLMKQFSFTLEEAQEHNKELQKKVIDKAQRVLIPLRKKLIESNSGSLKMVVASREKGISLANPNKELSTVNTSNPTSQIVTLSNKGLPIVNGKEFEGYVDNWDTILKNKKAKGETNGVWQIAQTGVRVNEFGKTENVYTAYEVVNNTDSISPELKDRQIKLFQVAETIKLAEKVYFGKSKEFSKEVAVQILNKVLGRNINSMGERERSSAIGKIISDLTGKFGAYPINYSQDQYRIGVVNSMNNPKATIITNIEIDSEGGVSLEEQPYQEYLKDNLYTPRKFVEIQQSNGESIWVNDIQPKIILEEEVQEEGNKEMQTGASMSDQYSLNPPQKQQTLAEKAKDAAVNSVSEKVVDTSRFNEAHIDTVQQNLFGKVLNNLPTEGTINSRDIYRTLVQQFNKIVKRLEENGFKDEAQFMEENKSTILGDTPSTYRDSVREELDIFLQTSGGEDLEINLTNGEVTKSFNKESFEQNISASLSARVKIFLAGIEKSNNKTFSPFGNLEIYEPVDNMVASLQEAFSKATNNNIEGKGGLIESMKNKINKTTSKRTGKSPYDFYNQIIEKLKTAPPELKKEIQYSLYNSPVSMSFIQFDIDSNDNWSVKVLNADSKDPRFSTSTNFINSLKESPLIDMLDSKKYKINKEVANNVLTVYKNLKKDYTDKKLNTEENERLIQSFLETFGINVQDGVILSLLNPEFVGSKVSLFTEKNNGLLDVLKNNMLAQMKEQEEGKELSFGENEKDSSVPGNISVYNNNSNFYEVVEMENLLNFNPAISTYIAHKTSNKYEQPKFITEHFKKLINPNDRTLLTSLANAHYSQNSMVVQMLMKYVRAGNNLSSKMGLGQVSLDAIKNRKGLSGGEVSELSLKDYFETVFGLFAHTDKELKEMERNGLKVRMAFMPFPAISDTGKMPLWKTVVYDLTKDDFTIEGENLDFSEKLINELYSQLVLPDLNRMEAFLLANKNTNIKGHDIGAGMILGLPGLNGMIIKDKNGNETTLLSALRNSIYNPNIDGNYSNFSEVLINNRELINSFLIDNINSEVDDLISFDENGKAKGLLVDNGLLREEGGLSGIDSKYIKSKGANLTVKQQARLTMTDFVINSMVNQANIQMVFGGDLANYVPEEVSKQFLNGNPSKISAETLEEVAGRPVSVGDLSFHSKVYENIGKQVGNNLSKRLKEYTSPGNKLANSFGKNSIQIMLSDTKVPSRQLLFYAQTLYPSKWKKYKKDIQEYLALEEISPEYRTESIEVNGIVYNKYAYLKDKIGKELPGIEPYMDITNTDAQEYVTWREHLNQLIEQGRVSQEMANNVSKKLTDQTEKGINRKNRLTQKEKEVIMQPTKPLYAGLHFEKYGNYNAQRYVYIKSASFPLLPELTAAFDEIDTLRKNVEKLQNQYKDDKGNITKTVRISYNSANKVGAIKNAQPVRSLYTELSDSELTNFQYNNSIELYKENFSIQQDKPFHTDSDIKEGKRGKINLGTQIEDIILGNGINLIKDKVFPNKFDDKILEKLDIEVKDGMISGEDLGKIYNHLAELQQKILSNKLLRKFGLSSFNELSNKNIQAFEKISKELNKRLTNRQDQDGISLTYKAVDATGKVLFMNKEELMKSGLKATSVDFKIPIWMLPNSTKFESVLNSIINSNSINLKISGFAGPVASQAGFKMSKKTLSEYFAESEEKDENSTDSFNGVIFTDSFDGELRSSRYENGNLKSFQVLVPNKFRVTKTRLDGTQYEELINMEDYVDEKTKRIDNTKLPKELLEMFSFRIPTSSHQSGCLVEIVGFLPHNSGDLIIVPGESTVQLGEDFDIDVRNFYMLNTINDEEGNLRAISYKDVDTDGLNNGIETLTKEYQDYKQELIDKVKADKSALWMNNQDNIAELAILEWVLETAYGDTASNALIDNILSNPSNIEGADTLSSESEIAKIKLEIEDLKATILPGTKVKEQQQVFEQQLTDLLAQIKQNFNEEKNALRQQIRSKSELTERYIENQIIGTYTSVYSSTDSRVSSLINQALNTDFAKGTAEEIDAVYNKEANNFSVFKPLYQYQVMNLGASGKLGIGVHSNWVTFNSILQQLSTEENPIRIEGLNLRFGNLKTDGTLGKINSDAFAKNSKGKSLKPSKYTPRLISVVNMENQNSATDNQKLQIMGRRNENKYTINAFALMCNLGLDSDGLEVNGKVMSYPSLFLAQPIIRDYVELMEYYSSITTLTFGNINKLVVERLKSKYGETITDETKQEELMGATSQTLFNELSAPTNDLQWALFENFQSLNKASENIVNLQSSFNIENGGLGISFFDTIELKDFLTTGIDEMEDKVPGITRLLGDKVDISTTEVEERERLVKDGYIEINPIEKGNGVTTFIKPGTYFGHKIVNAVTQGYNLWKNIFPFDSGVISNQINLIQESSKYKKDSIDIKEFKYRIVRNMQDYMYSGMTELFGSSDVSSIRERLLLDTDKNQSLATVFQILRNNNHPLMQEVFFKDLAISINKNDNPSIITYNVSTTNALQKNNVNKILNRYHKNNDIIKINGKPLMVNGEQITYKELIKDLLQYSFLSNQENGAIGFRNQFPLEIFDEYGVTSRLVQTAGVTNQVAHNVLYNGPIQAILHGIGEFNQDTNTIENTKGLSVSESQKYAEFINRKIGSNVATVLNNGDIKLNVSLENQKINFLRQYFQHNPEDAATFFGKEKKRILGMNQSRFFSDLNSFYVPKNRINPKDNFYPDYIQITEKGRTMLFEKNFDSLGRRYVRINTLGGFGVNEFSVSKANNNSLYAENAVPNNQQITVEPIMVQQEDSSSPLLQATGKKMVEKLAKNPGKFQLLAQLLLPYIDDNLQVILTDDLDSGVNGQIIKGSNKIYIKSTISEEIMPQVVLEEVLHSITVGKIEEQFSVNIENNGKLKITFKEGVTPAGRAMAKVYNAGFEAVKADLATKLGSEEKAVDRIHEFISKIENAKAKLLKGEKADLRLSEEEALLYRAVNIHEFLAGMFFNKEFQNVLNNTDYLKSGKSIFQKFAELLGRMIFPELKNNTVLEQSISSLIDILADAQPNPSVIANAEFEKSFDSFSEAEKDAIRLINTKLQENEGENLMFNSQSKKELSNQENIKPSVSELFESNFLIFAESKTSDEVISKLLSNKIIDKKCN